ncbi:MAG: hypothetical protein Q9191_006913 [Dirinaria sp. TL-2023a]
MTNNAEADYLARFANFTQDAKATALGTFNKLAKIQGWAPGSEEYEDERITYLLSAYDTHVGCLFQENMLQGLQQLCRELGVDTVPGSITKCKQILKGQVHVNIVNLIDSRRCKQKPKIFATAAALRKYTNSKKLFFPIYEAKGRPLLKVLLRHMFRNSK